MSVTTITRASRTLVAAGTSNAAAATTRGTLDCRTVLGGLLTLKITNGATGPTAQCTGKVLVSHNSGATPAAASAGAEWKSIPSSVFGGGTAANKITEFVYRYEGGMHLEVEFTGNTGQAVTVEALLTEDSSASTV